MACPRPACNLGFPVHVCELPSMENHFWMTDGGNLSPLLWRCICVVQYCNHGTTMFMYSVHVHWGCCHGYHRPALMSASECTTCLVMYWYMCSVYMSMVQWTIVRREDHISPSLVLQATQWNLCVLVKKGAETYHKGQWPLGKGCTCKSRFLAWYQIRACLEQVEAVVSVFP